MIVQTRAIIGNGNHWTVEVLGVWFCIVGFMGDDSLFLFFLVLGRKRTLKGSWTIIKPFRCYSGPVLLTVDRLHSIVLDWFDVED